MRRIHLYTRRGCCLCDDAAQVLARVRARAPFDLEVDDVDADPGLRARYGQLVPVVAIDGRDVFHFRVSEDELARALTRDGA